MLYTINNPWIIDYGEIIKASDDIYTKEFVSKEIAVELLEALKEARVLLGRLEEPLSIRQIGCINLCDKDITNAEK